MAIPKGFGVLIRVAGLVWLCLVLSLPAAQAAPYAAMVIDARSGQVLHSRNADTRLHPASLTKMMTLYVVFDAIERGEIDLDTDVLISKKAAAEPPSRLGLKAGQKIKLRYLIRAAAVKSANDAATAIGEAVSGSEAAFARRMNRMAKALGMSNTTFKNANGLTEPGHLSTARDMTTLGRHLFYDFPDYYNLFSRLTASAGTRTVSNTNTRFLNSYRGADGIKTGYTRAAGFNLVASAERGGERIIATVFGGRSTSWRNQRVAELLDMGFERAPSNVAVRKPERPVLTAEVETAPDAGKTTSATGLVARSPRPKLRPASEPAAEVLIAMKDGIADAIAEAVVVEPQPPVIAEAEAVAEAVAVALARTSTDAEAEEQEPAAVAAAIPLVRPRPRPGPVGTVELASVAEEPETPVVVTRMTTSGGRHWAINVGHFSTRHEAEKVLLQTALLEIGTLDDALRKVVHGNKGYEANFVGMTESTAELACRRLLAQNVVCTPLGPS